MRSLVLLMFGIAMGCVLTVSAMQRGIIKGAVLGMQPVCAVAIDTADWKLFEERTMGIAFRYPIDYAVTTKDGEVVVHRISPDLPDSTIVLTKERGGVEGKIDASMEQAGWKVNDRSLFAVQSPYLTDGDPTIVSSTYLFIRDYPRQTSGNTIIRARITEHLNDPTFRAAKMTKGKNETLTESEQILSTFRFLTTEEMYGLDGYQKK